MERQSQILLLDLELQDCEAGRQLQLGAVVIVVVIGVGVLVVVGIISRKRRELLVDNVGEHAAHLCELLGRAVLLPRLGGRFHLAEGGDALSN